MSSKNLEDVIRYIIYECNWSIMFALRRKHCIVAYVVILIKSIKRGRWLVKKKQIAL